MQTIEICSLAGQRVLVRVDFNVPLDPSGRITDETRIREALPTLRRVLEEGGRLIVASHMGRPKGQRVAKYSLAPVAGALSTLLGRPVALAPDCIGGAVAAQAAALQPGEVLLLENLRFHPEEERNDPDFARALASLCDIYVNDAFAVSHRANASVEAIVRFAPRAVAGLLLHRELDYFARALEHPRRPLVAVVGGAKVSTKLGALQNLLRKVDAVIVGGAMANTFLLSRGLALGASLVEPDLVPMAADILQAAEERQVRFLLPQDAVIAERLTPDALTRVVAVDAVPAGWLVGDIGPATAALFGTAIEGAGTVVWNGPMGAFELAPFSAGTEAMVRQVAAAAALTIVGGGDTDVAVHRFGGAERIGYISTGGGAFLELLEGKTLPAVAALEAAQPR
jgi:phosphoglycerate kinase